MREIEPLRAFFNHIELSNRHFCPHGAIWFVIRSPNVKIDVGHVTTVQTCFSFLECIDANKTVKSIL